MFASGGNIIEGHTCSWGCWPRGSGEGGDARSLRAAVRWRVWDEDALRVQTDHERIPVNLSWLWVPRLPNCQELRKYTQDALTPARARVGRRSTAPRRRSTSRHWSSWIPHHANPGGTTSKRRDTAPMENRLIRVHRQRRSCSGTRSTRAAGTSLLACRPQTSARAETDIASFL